MHVDRMNYVGKPITMKMGYICIRDEYFKAHIPEEIIEYIVMNIYRDFEKKQLERYMSIYVTYNEVYRKKQELYFFRDNPKYIKQINKSVSMLFNKIRMIFLTQFQNCVDYFKTKISNNLFSCKEYADNLFLKRKLRIKAGQAKALASNVLSEILQDIGLRQFNHQIILLC